MIGLNEILPIQRLSKCQRKPRRRRFGAVVLKDDLGVDLTQSCLYPTTATLELHKSWRTRFSFLELEIPHSSSAQLTRVPSGLSTQPDVKAILEFGRSSCRDWGGVLRFGRLCDSSPLHLPESSLGFDRRSCNTHRHPLLQRAIPQEGGGSGGKVQRRKNEAIYEEPTLVFVVGKIPASIPLSQLGGYLALL